MTRRRISQENAFNYDKGVLAEILEPIMGKGLIPADLETWKPRRRAIVPAFHKAYLQAMVRMFCSCTQRSVEKFDSLTADGGVNTTLPPPPGLPSSRSPVVGDIAMQNGGTLSSFSEVYWPCCNGATDTRLQICQGRRLCDGFASWGAGMPLIVHHRSI